MDEELMGTIKLFAGNFAPVGYFTCEGQLLSIRNYTALFAILGTYYGGDGVTTFKLPDLRGAFPTQCTNTGGIPPGGTYSLEENGGKIAFNHATGYKEEDFTIAPLKDHLEKFPNSALLSLFSGDFVHWYFEAIKNSFEEQNIPIYLPPFGLEEMMLADAEYPGDNIKGIAAWSKKIDSEENKIFIETITAANRTPNIFSLLSWESASLALKVIELIDLSKNNMTQIASGIKSFTFKSPRGTIYFDSKTNTSISPLYNSTIIPNSQGKCEIKIESIVNDVSEHFQKLTNQNLNNSTSAWYNSYTCI